MIRKGSSIYVYRKNCGGGYDPGRKSCGRLPGEFPVVPEPHREADRGQGFHHAEGDLAKNPYIAYNCLRLCGKIALVTNGSQTDPIIEKIIAGMNLRDALALPLLAMDYEKDSLNTPRIAAAVDAEKRIAVLGIVRHDALLVKEFALEPGKIYYLSTYEKNAPCKCNCDEAFEVSGADALCAYMISGGVFADFEKPVTAAGALWNGSGYSLAAADAKTEA